jgi:seryl-tRNA synthetase
MPKKTLQEELEKLRLEVDKVVREDTEAREKLESLIGDLEKKLDTPEDEAHHDNLLKGLKDAINQFEAEHPRATAILNDIMVTLSNMGI